MHILHVIDSLSLGGAERMAVDIANCSDDRGLNVSVCETWKNGILSSELNDDIELLTLKRKKSLDLFAIRTFARWVIKQRVDILHVHCRTSLKFVLTAKYLHTLNVNLVFHDHYGKIDIDTSTPMWFRFFANRNIVRYVGVSNALCEWAIRSGINKSKVREINNCLDFERLVTHSDKTLNEFIEGDRTYPVGILTCGLRQEKGVEVLIRSLATLKNLDLKILVFGGEAEPGYFHYIKGLVRELGVEDQIVFVGPRSDVSSFMELFDFAVMPSISESGPLVLIEYAAKGLPFISTRTGSISQTLEKCGVGVFIPPDDVVALASALEKMVQLNSNSRENIVAATGEIAKREFDLREKIHLWIDLYKSMAGE